MAVATKKRRRLIREGRLFIWYVLPDEDSTDRILHVFSDDKRFMVHYVLGQDESRALVAGRASGALRLISMGLSGRGVSAA
ncbi:MAG: hypothetical protein JWM59_3369 [Verrucomicrobiales bacterium]|nr:hypothetical protein [Verrucomicrobiales bacterium]